jgi:hypothetical protein
VPCLLVAARHHDGAEKNGDRRDQQPATSGNDPSTRSHRLAFIVTVHVSTVKMSSMPFQPTLLTSYV